MPPTVVIVGGGFGGLACAQALNGAPCRVVLVDKRNHHLFQPLLYQVATAALSPAEIASPLRHVLARCRNVEVRLGEVTGVDLAGRTLTFEGQPPLPFDRLVLATGGAYSWFGRDDWMARAPGLKTLSDARAVRRRLLSAFEQAEVEPDAAVRRRLMTFVIVGGGPTGVEMAGAVAELANWTLRKDFRHIDPRDAQVILLEAGPRLLAGFPERLSAYALRALERLGVEVRLGCAVTDVDDAGVRVGEARIEADAVLWAAGIAAAPGGGWLGVQLDRASRVPVAPDLSVPGLEGVYALGDATVLAGESGRPLPALAQVAQQQGYHLGRGLKRQLRTGAPLRPFRFRNRGNTAVIGRHAAVFDFGGLQFTGRTAWMLWSLVHVYLLVGFSNRLMVSLQWVWSYFTGERGARLID